MKQQGNNSAVTVVMPAGGGGGRAYDHVYGEFERGLYVSYCIVSHITFTFTITKPIIASF